MNAAVKSLLAVVVLAAVGGAGYWLGRQPAGQVQGSAPVDAASAPAAAASQPRKLLYYRNPMGLADTSPTPKKDSMGMDYIPVYQGGDEAAGTPAAAGTVRISTEKVQRLGVRTEAASLRALGRVLRASGRVEPDERRMFAIAPKFEGYVERLHVNVTGQPVVRGQPLFEVYSPELVSAQREYLIAVQGVQAMQAAGGEALAGMRQLAASSLARLANWDLSPEQIDALVKTGEVRRSISFRSPVAGIVTEKKAMQGMRFMPGEPLYQVTDLASVWVIADVFEQDIAQLRIGAAATLQFTAFPEQRFKGSITYIYPTLNAGTRTVPVRVELANPRQLLKPAMFAQVELAVGAAAKVLAVPESAVIDSGLRRLVLVQLAEGRFEPREVQLGERSDSHVQVLSGLREGEQVVVAANFLIDAESNLQAVIGGMGAPPAAPAAPAAARPAAVGHRGEGRIDAIDGRAGTLSLSHGPIASLKWPAMTMDFQLANSALLQGLKPGAAVRFEFVERQPGEWVITAISPASQPAARR